MDPLRWRRIETLVHEAGARAGEARAAFLAEACGDDVELRGEVESLLNGASAAERWLESSAGRAPALAPGVRLGAYEVLGLLGAGGMGEVYEARDTRLDRRVAIKVLPDLFKDDPDRLARFEREAKVLASLNHPHIAQVYGFEALEGVQALVLEFVDGGTLADRVAHGPMPVAEAVAVAKQIAEALDAAHERGVIHRDLKPANIKVTAEGSVKVLDFGLAKAIAGDGSGVDLSASPTVTAAGTRAGVILGTAAYMSPEQARGRPVDKRTDIWAFGCVVYELLTGRAAFRGETVSDTVAALLEREPDWTVLPAGTPAGVRRLLERCLEKDAKRRLRDIGDVAIELEHGSVDPAPAAAIPGPRRRRRWATGASIAAALLLVAALAGLVTWRVRGPRATSPPARITLSLSADNSLVLGGGVAISPDGQTIVFVARSLDGIRLYARRLGDWEPRPIPGTERAATPFFSPDGQWVAFWRPNVGLEKIPLGGGPPQLICRFPLNVIGASWGSDGRIIFGARPNAGLWRVWATGGEPESVLQPGDGRSVLYTWPERLGDKVLFTVKRQGRNSIAALVPGTTEPRTVIESGSNPRYLPTGHLLYVADGHLFAVPFDARSLEVRGTAIVVVDDINEGQISADYDVSASGSLVYLPGWTTLRRLVWKDRRGTTIPLAVKLRGYHIPYVSPDGRRVAVAVQEGSARNLWVGSVDGEPLTRLTFGNDDVFALWTPDGRRVVFTSGQSGRYNLYWTSTDGSGAAERLTESEHAQKPTSWSPRGDVLLLNDIDPSTGADVWTLSLDRREARPFVRTPFRELEAAFSPDGHWVAYQSNESGRFEVYVRPYPGPGAKKQVSVDGGEAPWWNRNGRELFYQGPAAMMVVPVLDARDLRTGAPQPLFAYIGHVGESGRDFDVSPDGQRFLKSERVGAGQSQLNVVVNWFEELKAKAPKGP